MTHTKEQKENILLFLTNLQLLLDEHKIRLDVPVKLTSLSHGYIGSLEHNYNDLYIVDEDTFLELYSTVNEGKND
jgi:hypothetical protein